MGEGAGDGIAARKKHAALLSRAVEQHASGDLPAALATCREALELSPDDSETYRVMGGVLLWRGEAEEAIDALNEAIRLDPSNAKAWKKLSQAASAQGRTDAALAACRRALEIQPKYVGALTHLASLKRFTSTDDDDLATLGRRAADADITETDRRVLLFALAKAYEDLHSYDRAFAYLVEANRLARKQLDYDLSGDLCLFERITRVFSRGRLDDSRGFGADSEVPILIVGMPRSGTTLVEQILASHPDVHAGGERPDLTETAYVATLMTPDLLPFPNSVEHTPRELLNGLGEGFARRLGDLAPGALRVTDKTPQNFCYLGLVHLMLPNAKIIHCVRDPVDTCFSCYALNLVNFRYTFDLTELGAYYRGYARVMDHWRSVLPAGWVLEVRYEDLVADVDAVARRMVAHCGLGWDDACLAFHTLDRPVITASATQVHQPIYTSSVSRWRRYKRHLGELLTTLGLDADGQPLPESATGGRG